MYIFPVSFPADISLTGCLTLVNMIIQAGAFFAGIPRQISAAAADLIQLSYQFYGLFHSSGTGIGSKIFCFILPHLPGKENTRKIFLHCNLDKRITLVILQHGIVFRPVFLDQITFQYQRLQFRICHDILKALNVRHHLFNLHAFVPAGLKILAHPVFQADRLSHINDFILLPVHNINPRSGRQFF